MRILIQRVKKASVVIDEKLKSSIAKGLLIFVGIEHKDTDEDVKWLCNKILNLRIFDDENGVMNKSVQDCAADICVVSQFTLQASTQKGNRPSYIKAAKPPIAIPLYETFCASLELDLKKPIARGVFGADMQVELVNDGPVTIWIDSQQRE